MPVKIAQADYARAKGMLFNTPMTQAIRDNLKTVTRRPIKKPCEIHEYLGGLWVTKPRNFPDEYCRFHPYNPYAVDDIFYVRENFNSFSLPIEKGKVTYYYAADSDNPDNKWRPNIHMPKTAARFFIRVIKVSIQQLQDITEEQAIQEGFRPIISFKDGAIIISAKGKFNAEIIDLYGIDFYNSNPYFWVIEFEPYLNRRNYEQIRN